MRSLRRPPVVVLALVIAAGCARCSSRPPPVERFIAADTAAALVIPTLDGFARQSSELLGAAAGLPFGGALRDARSVLAGRLSFDPADAGSMAGAGLDPSRGAALFGRVGDRGPDAPDVVLSLPVGDAAKLEATIATLARERLGATERIVDAGSPDVVTWRAEAGRVVLAYALVERTALVSMGAAAVPTIRAAASVPATRTLGGAAAYQRSMKVLGDGVAAAFYAPAGSAAVRDFAQFRDGVAFGLRGGKDRLSLTAAMPRTDAAEGARATTGSGELMARLDPGAVLVVRGDGAADPMIDPADLTASLALQGIPRTAGEPMADFLASLGGSSAIAVSLVPQSGKPASLQAEPLRVAKLELLLSVEDPAKMTGAIQRAAEALGSAGVGKVDVARRPFRMPWAGGEVSLAVSGDTLALAAGPKGSLDALLGRSGTTFKGPTPASDAALKGGNGGMFLDVPRLAAGVQALPEASFGPGEQGVMLKSMVDQYAGAAARVTALSVRSERVDGFARGELLVELSPPATPTAR